MNRPLRMVWHLARADYLERVRRHSFLVTIAVTVWFAYVSTPPNNASYVTTQIGGARGIYNSAWIGSVVAMLTGIFLAIAGFYVVKSAVRRDRTTGVGQILATTPLTKPLYTLGKAASNFGVLATIVLVVAVASIGMQWIRGEDRHIDLVQLLTPFAIVTLPAMAVVAASAVLFETIPFLNGGLGNVIYVFFVIGVVMTPTIAARPDTAGNDVMGVRMVVPSMFEARAAAFPGNDVKQGGFSMGFNFRKEGTWNLKTFRWEGVRWNARMVAARLVWFLAGAMIAILAAIPFDRFDPSRRPARAMRTGRRQAPEAGTMLETATGEVEARDFARARTSTGTLTAPRRAPSLVGLTVAELRLMLRGMPKPWWMITIGLVIAEALTPLFVARGFMLPFAWIWPIVLWSGMGAKARQHQTDALLFSSPHPISSQLSATWLAGFAVACSIGAPVAVRLAIAGDFAGIATWLTGAAFVPSMALALGTWSGGGKLFEGLYLALWYMGPMNRIPFLDFIGVSAESTRHRAWIPFAVATLILLVLAVLGRRRELRR